MVHPHTSAVIVVNERGLEEITITTRGPNRAAGVQFLRQLVPALETLEQRVSEPPQPPEAAA
jgi:hypothetical protein